MAHAFIALLNNSSDKSMLKAYFKGLEIADLIDLRVAAAKPSSYRERKKERQKSKEMD